MSVLISNNTKKRIPFNYEVLITMVINAAKTYVKCPFETEVSVTIVDNDEIQSINKEYRNIDNPTDVLSFPMQEYVKEADFSAFYIDTNNKPDYSNADFFNPTNNEFMLGDIILSIEKIEEQAKAYNHSLLREMAFLVAHSMLHLFGFDHMNDEERKIMEEKQEKILKELYISRMVKNTDLINIILLNEAKKALSFSYSPYSKFKVGAAVLCADKSIVTGCNVENSSYPVSICAERVAISKAISMGKAGFSKIAIVSGSNTYTYPCGMCRQFIYEFMKNGSVIVCNEDEICELKIKNLLPKGFELGNGEVNVKEEK